MRERQDGFWVTNDDRVTLRASEPFEFQVLMDESPAVRLAVNTVADRVTMCCVFVRLLPPYPLTSSPLDNFLQLTCVVVKDF